MTRLQTLRLEMEQTETFLNGFDEQDDIMDYISVTDDGSGSAELTIDADGTGSETVTASVTLNNVAVTDNLIQDTIDGGNLVIYDM